MFVAAIIPLAILILSAASCENNTQENASQDDSSAPKNWSHDQLVYISRCSETLVQYRQTYNQRTLFCGVGVPPRSTTQPPLKGEDYCKIGILVPNETTHAAQLKKLTDADQCLLSIYYAVIPQAPERLTICPAIILSGISYLNQDGSLSKLPPYEKIQFNQDRPNCGVGGPWTDLSNQYGVRYFF